MTDVKDVLESDLDHEVENILGQGSDNEVAIYEINGWAFEVYKLEVASLIDPERNKQALEKAEATLDYLMEQFGVKTRPEVPQELKSEWIVALLRDLSADYTRLKIRSNALKHVGDDQGYNNTISMMTAVEGKVRSLLEYRREMQSA